MTAVPEIRFMRDDGTDFPDWVQTQLGNETNWLSGGTPSKAIERYWNGDIPWISAASMHEAQIHDSPISISLEGLANGSRLASKGSILLLVRGSMLFNRIPICRAMRDVAFNQDVKCIRASSNEETLFIFHWLQANESRLLSMVTGTGIGAGKLDTIELQSLIVGIPHPDEQQKIATFLGAVDDKIDALRRKHASLKQFKSGLMQKLFSQDLRFKRDDGSDFPDWEEKRLGDVANVFSGGTPTATKASYFGGAIPFIKSAEIGSSAVAQTLSESGLANSSAKLVEKGDLLYALYGANAGDVAFARLDGAINQAVLCIRPELKRSFLLPILSARRGRIRATYLQGGQGNLSADIVKSLSVPVPHPVEQQKIADCLSAVDTKIEAVAGQITQMEAFKRGLLQKMFV